VDLELISRDVIHSFWIPKLHGKVDLVPGLTNSIRIEADHAGTYDGECGEFCGVQHAHMRLRVVAEEPKAFMQWLDAQRSDAVPPRGDLAIAGKRIFEQGPCALCHTVRGTAAHGDVGPDLTHFGSRKKFAGDSIENNTANLSAWITHAQSLKAGAQMPDMTFFTGTELRQLTAYLQGLQ
jgi:cytochrome c oxidase subunit 2